MVLCPAWLTADDIAGNISDRIKEEYQPSQQFYLIPNKAK